MTNDFSMIPAESEFRDAMTSTLEELGQDIADLAPELPIDEMHNGYNGERETPLGEQLDEGVNGIDDLGCEPDCGWAGHFGWPGDGSGSDDLADFNANEVDDYSNE